MFKQINKEKVLVHGLVFSSKINAPFVPYVGEERLWLTQLRVCIIFMQETAASYTAQ
jgi:hypothetical protein